MVNTLEQAIAQLSRLPDADQEQIGRKLLSHVEKLTAFHAEIDKGIRSLDAGKGSALDIEDFLRRKNLTSNSRSYPAAFAAARPAFLPENRQPPRNVPSSER